MILMFVNVLFAKNLATVLDEDLGNASKLSNGVEGIYYAPANLSANVIATGHSKGDTTFATGSMTTSLWAHDLGAVPDNMTNSLKTDLTKPSDYSDNNTSTIFSKFTEQ